MSPSLDNELYHYGVPGMKWGVRKDRYKAMTKEQRKKQRMAYRRTPEGAKRTTIGATVAGTLLGGPLVGAAAGLATHARLNKNSTLGQVSRKVKEKGKKKVESFLSDETDEQKITRLMAEGKAGDNWDYLFDQNGKLFYAAPKKK